MNNNDISQKFIFENASIRGEIVKLNESFSTIMKQHQYPPLIRQLLGEMLVVACLLCTSLKFKGRITVQFQGKGKLKLLLAQCNSEFEIRGVAQWQEGLAQAELPHEQQNGLLVITMESSAKNAKPYQGIVAWQGNSLAEAIEAYFKNSEQIPTRLWLAVNEHQATGLLIQAMPKEIEKLGKKELEDVYWEHVIQLSQTISNEELLTLDNEIILQRLYAQEKIRLFPAITLRFHCPCTRQRSENALLLLPKSEIEDELQKKQSIVVTCDFCNKEYMFDRVDIERIFRSLNNPDSSTQIH